MNTFLILEHDDNEHSRFLYATNNIEKLIQEILKMNELDCTRRRIRILVHKDNDETINFTQYIENKNKNNTETMSLSLEETPADILVNRILYLIKYLEDKIDKKGLEKITEILYGKK